VPETRPTISTHVLDTAIGSPRAGVRVRLWRTSSAPGGGAAAPAGGSADPARLVGEATTDADGRVRDLLGGRPLESGGYRLEFELGPGYFASLAIDVRIEDASRSHHVPLLVAPFGLATYRGS
jgi:5-hydroxyisourate hydrolase